MTREEFPLEKAREVLKDETIAVIGYGVQGPGQACNLRDNGFNVIVEELLSDSFGREIGDTHAADLDRSFTKTLILHCRLAVDLSELALDYSDDGEVKDLAEEMIEQHTAQVDKLQALLQSPG